MDEDATAALLTELIRVGVINEEIVEAAVLRCEAQDQAMAAHQLRCLIVEAGASPPGTKPRPRLHVISDGGNDR